MIFVNFKTYQEGTGKNAILLAKILEEVAHTAQIKIIPVVQAADIKDVVLSTSLPVWTQKIDPLEPGAHTGSILAEGVIEDGAVGTFLNHSESKFANFDDLARASDRAKANNLQTLIFAANPGELKDITSLTPTYLSYEPPELVGSTTDSVASRPEAIREASEIAKLAGIPLIVGAGVKSTDDVRKCLQEGAVGFAVASSILKAEDPRAEILKLVEGFK